MTKNAYPTHPRSTKYMDRQDLPHNSWQREMHDEGWRFLQQPPAPTIEVVAARNQELEAIVAENVGALAVEHERELVAA